jgi:transposase
MLVSWGEVPRSPGHAFYDKLQGVLIAAGSDRFVETQCAVEYAPRLGRPIAATGTLVPYQPALGIFCVELQLAKIPSNQDRNDRRLD